MRQTDISQNPQTPSFPLGASSDEAYDHAQLVNSPVEAPGAIVSRLEGQQWNVSRATPNYELMDAEPAAQHPTQWGINPGT